MSHRRITALTLAVAGLALSAAAPGGSLAAELPLGLRGLKERRTVTAVAPGVTWTHVVRGRHSFAGITGPWRVDILTIEPGVRLGVQLSNGLIPGREPVSAMAAEAGALAAVNGGFFGSEGLFDGDPIGALGLGGQLISEPVGGRAALLLPPPAGGRARVAGLRFAGAVGLGEETRLLDGMNRGRGRIPSCGGRGGDLPRQRAGAVPVCSDESELVQYTPLFGARTGTTRDGAEAVVRAGAVTTVREGGNSRIPADGYVLSGSGDAADFLLRLAVPGVAPAVDLSLTAGGSPVRAGSWGSIVGGGPRLVKRGRLRVRAVTEGFSSAFAARNPRTLAGVTPRGRLLLVTIDGRSTRSVGATLVEAARVMRSLGARNALNLDGGGSTTMVVGGRVVNRPSDGIERSVADALVVLPPAAAAARQDPAAVVWAVGDGADGSARAKRLAHLIAADGPDRFLYLGDVYETGTAAEFKRNFGGVYGSLADITEPTPGNHDWGRRRVGYFPYWGAVKGRPQRPWYRFESGGWEIFALNSEAAHGPASRQVRWLRRQLDGAVGTCRLAFWHRPRLSAGVYGDDASYEPFWRALRGKARLVLSGHDHNLQRLRARDGIVQLVAGAGGRELYPLHADRRLRFGRDDRVGALRLELEPGEARLEFRQLDGRTIDEARVGCEPG